MTMTEKVAAALVGVEFRMPGAGGLRGKLALAPAQATAMASAAINAMAESADKIDIDEIIERTCTKPQRREIQRMTRCGDSKIGALKRLIRLGCRVRQRAGLEDDLTHGTDNVIPKLKA